MDKFMLPTNDQSIGLSVFRRCALAVLSTALFSATSFAQTAPTTQPQISKTDVVQLSAEQESALRKVLEVQLKPQNYYPSLGAGIPTGFGANWGDVMVGVSGALSDKGRGQADGSLSLTGGLFDSVKYVGVEVSANVLSVRNFGTNVNFDAKVHRMLYQGEEGYLSLAIGRNNFACSGTEICSSTPNSYGIAPNTASNYAALSGLTPIKGLNGTVLPLKATLGVGNGYFSNNWNKSNNYNVFGDVGLQFHNQIGVSAGWSGVGINANISAVPFPEWPVIVNLLFADIAGQSPGGFNAILSVGVPFNFLK